MSRNDVFHAAGDHDPRLKETHQQAQQDLGFDIPIDRDWETAGILNA